MSVLTGAEALPAEAMLAKALPDEATPTEAVPALPPPPTVCRFKEDKTNEMKGLVDARMVKSAKQFDRAVQAAEQAVQLKAQVGRVGWGGWPLR